MHKYLIEDEWMVIEDHFDPKFHKSSESLFSLGNGHMGLRANFEESYSGPSLQGSYIAGIYYPDKTRVGWWKNGYPEYFAKVLNAPSWIRMSIQVDGKELDLFTMKVHQFTRTLDMHKGLLIREFKASWPDGTTIKVETERFLSMKRKEIAAIRYRITPVDCSPEINANLIIDGDVRNQDSNYDEKFWEPITTEIKDHQAFVVSRTRKSGFEVCTAQWTQVQIYGDSETPEIQTNKDNESVSASYRSRVRAGDTIELIRFAAVVTSRDYTTNELILKAEERLTEAAKMGYLSLRTEQFDSWQHKWELSDIRINGDVSAQQGIRFNIFHLNQTYTGHDPRLNIGPKGFTGEKYGGSTYWDTEAFCLPFYLSTTDSQIAKNLLVYRYRHLEKAIENAEKLGFTDGAALYPMVTINGEECHNEWEITFEEIHRNGAIAYAIYNYIRHTGDDYYLAEKGLEVLIALSRFWSQRTTFSDVKQKFVILGVTGPNEYENNVNNNWYTNYLAAWTLAYTMESLDLVLENYPDDFDRVMELTGWPVKTETNRWQSIIQNIFLPENKEVGIFLQQEGYLDKEQMLASELNPAIRPLNQHWSWDRILRSCFIKQADVLQGLYFFEDQFDLETIRRNFDFYEPRTVHESSLSPCVHVILASKLGYTDKAYELYLRTSRLDLDDYNHEVHEGCHITSMAGTWMAVVEGFGGMEVSDNQLNINPVLPDTWKELSFTIHFRGLLLHIVANHKQITISEHQGKPFQVIVNRQAHQSSEGKPLCVRIKE